MLLPTVKTILDFTYQTGPIGGATQWLFEGSNTHTDGDWHAISSGSLTTTNDPNAWTSFHGAYSRISYNYYRLNFQNNDGTFLRVSDFRTRVIDNSL